VRLVCVQSVTTKELCLETVCNVIVNSGRVHAYITELWSGIQCQHIPPHTIIAKGIVMSYEFFHCALDAIFHGLVVSSLNAFSITLRRYV